MVGGAKMKRNPLLLLDEIELRDSCRHQIDSFEQWSRRLIDEKLKEGYDDNYLNAEVLPGQPLIKSKIKDKIAGRMHDNPERYPRWIDAIVMEDIEYFFCRDDLYKEYYNIIFEPFFSGKEEVRSVLKRLTAIRNKLSHGNTISMHEAEQSICYTNDFIECYKRYYDKEGKSREYNVPVFMRIKDSLGNDLIREHMNWYPWEEYWEHKSYHGKPKVILRSGESYKIWCEVDGSFPEDTYDVTWKFKCGKKVLEGQGCIVEVSFDDKDVSYTFKIFFYLKTHNTWHRRAQMDNDDEIELSFSDILPPIDSTY